MAQTVIGIFRTENEAQRAVQELMNDGFLDANIDYSSGFGSDSNLTDTSIRNEDNDNAVERFFKNLFGDDDNDQVGKYSTVARNANYLVTVHADSADEAERASDILDLYGAVDVDQQASEYRYSSGATSAADLNTDASYNRTSDLDLDTQSDVDLDVSRRGTTTDETSIPVVEENLQVGKREVETGGVRVRSRIIERPVEESVRLRQEKVWVQRNPVNKPATEADFNVHNADVVLTEHGERAVVSKEARVVEEVRVGKEVEERSETVRDTVRKTEVDVDNLTNQNLRNTDNPLNRDL